MTPSLSVGARIGAAVASRLGDRLGRRRAIMVAALVVIIGTVACVLAQNLPELGRDPAS